MTTIIHLSDFHFGKDLPRIADALVSDVIEQGGDLVAFSGDATQRALRDQYRAARDYIARLPAPFIAVPGNHDLPLYNPIARAVSPRKGYREHISRDTEPSFTSEHLALVSIDTSRHYFWKDGRVSSEQLERMGRAFAAAPPGACRVVMMHHPCFVPPEFPVHNRVDNADAALDAMSAARVEVVLAGHMHDAFVVRIEADPPYRPAPVILSQAGTAISSRRRSQPNSYNVVFISEGFIEVAIRMWEGSGFAEVERRSYERLKG
jgi:3',5'-cyclic AMP phosphodiesterase CpdA